MTEPVVLLRRVRGGYVPAVRSVFPGHETDRQASTFSGFDRALAFARILLERDRTAKFSVQPEREIAVSSEVPGDFIAFPPTE